MLWYDMKIRSCACSNRIYNNNAMDGIKQQRQQCYPMGKPKTQSVRSENNLSKYNETQVL